MNSTLIIRGGAIGDFVLTLPAVHAFRDHFPNARVEWLGYPHIAELGHGRFYASAVRSLDHRTVAAFFASRSALDEDLSRYFSSFDLVVSYLYDPDRVFENNLRRAGGHRVLIADCRPSGEGHASSHLARWLSDLGIPLPTESPKLYPTQDDLVEAIRLFPNLQRPTVVLHLGSGSPEKNWPVQSFLDLATWLRQMGVEVLVVTGPADSEADSHFWKSSQSQGCQRCHDLALPLLAAVLKQCTAFVGHDSGISHIAAAVGAPTFALFGATDPAIWAPRGVAVKIIRRGTGVSMVTVNDVKTELKSSLRSLVPP